MNSGKDMLRVMVSDAPFPSEAIFDERLGADAEAAKVTMHLEDGKWMVQNEEWGK
jgi:hypothetical protein